MSGCYLSAFAIGLIGFGSVSLSGSAFVNDRTDAPPSVRDVFAVYLSAAQSNQPRRPEAPRPPQRRAQRPPPTPRPLARPPLERPAPPRQWRLPDARASQEPALARGYADGYEIGLDNGRDRNRYDPVGSRSYRAGDSGYYRDYGPRDAYRNNYRAGFRQGYETGYRDGSRGRR
jgi:hypothetical protein